jgi:ABC-type multidrug transport system ATPase subunit
MSAEPELHQPNNEIELVPQGSSAHAGVEPDLRGAEAPHLPASETVSVIGTGDFKRTNLTIGYRDVSMTVRIPKEDQGIQTMISPLITAAKVIGTCGDNLRRRDFHRLDNISGVLRPGTMTLILAPPGHGKSSFLKAMSSRIPVTGGTIVYNGLTAQEAAEEGCNTRRLTQYVDQVDEHLPLLTVTETLDFAHRVTCSHYDPARVENTIRLLGLEECKNTILGNGLIRGVSGGQKRRVTLGEMLVGDACALFLDEYTNGLDTATSEDITRGLRRWVEQTNGMIVASLQQPTPGLYAMFDNILVLRDSQIVYDGPRVDLEPYFSSMGYNCPSDVDVCDFVIDCMSQPRVALDRLQHNEHREARAAAKAGSAVAAPAQSWQVTHGELHRAASPCVTTAQMIAHYKASPMWASNGADLDKACPVAATTSAHDRPHEPLMPSPEAVDMYKVGYTLPLGTLFNIVFTRSWLNMKRNKGIIAPRFFQAIIMGLLYGSLYWQIPTENFYLRVAILLISQTQVGFGSMVELATSVENNLIVFKQAGASFYPTYMYVFSAAVTGIPIFLVESMLLSIVIYFMSGCVLNAGNFFIFYCIIILTCFMMSIWFRMLSALARDEPSAHAIAGPSTGIFIMFGGFFVTMANLPVWMRWIMWYVCLSLLFCPRFKFFVQSFLVALFNTFVCNPSFFTLLFLLFFLFSH